MRFHPLYMIIISILLSTHSEKTTNITHTCMLRIVEELCDRILGETIYLLLIIYKHTITSSELLRWILYMIRYQKIRYSQIKRISTHPISIPHQEKWYIKNISKCIYYTLVLTRIHCAHTHIHAHTLLTYHLTAQP